MEYPGFLFLGEKVFTVPSQDTERNLSVPPGRTLQAKLPWSHQDSHFYIYPLQTPAETPNPAGNGTEHIPGPIPHAAERSLSEVPGYLAYLWLLPAAVLSSGAAWRFPECNQLPQRCQHRAKFCSCHTGASLEQLLSSSTQRTEDLSLKTVQFNFFKLPQ